MLGIVGTESSTQCAETDNISNRNEIQSITYENQKAKQLNEANYALCTFTACISSGIYVRFWQQLFAIMKIDV